MRIMKFQVDVNFDDALSFAKLSGDWNPLHTDQEHAANTAFRYPVLHGAYSAGLLSRLAGMYLPGEDCLLHNMRLNFIAPIIPPAKLEINGNLIGEKGGLGRVEVTISDATRGIRYVDGYYEFSRYNISEKKPKASRSKTKVDINDTRTPPILVTGATGGLGQAVLKQFGDRAIGISRGIVNGMIQVEDLCNVEDALGGSPISGIVHCAWPSMDNERLTDLTNIKLAVEHNVAIPLGQMISLSHYLSKYGTKNALFVLIGSTAALPGRHNYRMPLYSLSKSLIPELTRILATELGSDGKRCASIIFDVINAGMNKRLSPAARVAHADRSPVGRLPSADEAASQIKWLFDNAEFLVSGASISLTGCAVP